MAQQCRDRNGTEQGSGRDLEVPLNAQARALYAIHVNMCLYQLSNKRLFVCSVSAQKQTLFSMVKAPFGLLFGVMTHYQFYQPTLPFEKLSLFAKQFIVKSTHTHCIINQSGV